MLQGAMPILPSAFCFCQEAEVGEQMLLTVWIQLEDSLLNRNYLLV